MAINSSVLRLLVQNLLPNVQFLKLVCFGGNTVNLPERLRKAGVVFISQLMKYFSGLFMMIFKQAGCNFHAAQQQPFIGGAMVDFFEPSFKS